MPISADESGRRAPHLVIEGLAAGYGNTEIISEIDLSVGMSEIVTIVGPNGAGKSTLLRAVMGRIPTIRGEVTLGGDRITNLRADSLAKRGVGYVPQTKDVFDTLTVRENLEMGGYLLPRSEVAARVETVLGTFPVLADMRTRIAGRLSGGERKMLAIGRVLMRDPSVLILDEPTAGLSPELSRRVLREEVRGLAERGMAVLLVEQKALDALDISTWGYVLVAGRIKICGSAEELLGRSDIREVFLGSTGPVVGVAPGKLAQTGLAKTGTPIEDGGDPAGPEPIGKCEG
jgi:branched-chain amino acid transport system ATP-binding protein